MIYNPTAVRIGANIPCTVSMDGRGTIRCLVISDFSKRHLLLEGDNASYLCVNDGERLFVRAMVAGKEVQVAGRVVQSRSGYAPEIAMEDLEWWPTD